jgi:hypothetical protein
MLLGGYLQEYVVYHESTCIQPCARQCATARVAAVCGIASGSVQKCSILRFQCEAVHAAVQQCGSVRQCGNVRQCGVRGSAHGSVRQCVGVCGCVRQCAAACNSAVAQQCATAVRHQQCGSSYTRQCGSVQQCAL